MTDGAWICARPALRIAEFGEEYWSDIDVASAPVVNSWRSPEVRSEKQISERNVVSRLVGA